MFLKWARSSKTAHEPKTPRFSSIPLLPEQYTPVSYHQQHYDPNPHPSYFQAAAPRQAMAPMVDSPYSYREPIPTKSRSRTTSTPIKAPTPILPHHSQGRLAPHSNRMSRANSTQAHLAPVAVPSVEYLEGIAQKKPGKPSLADLPIPVSQAADLKIIRKGEILAKKLGTTLLTPPSKAFLEDQAERRPADRERAEKERVESELARRKIPQSYEDFPPISTTTPSKCQIEELRERGRPEDMLSQMRQVPSKAYLQEQEEKLAARAQVPLKSALKKTGSLKPTLKSILKKKVPVQDETKAYYSENDSAKRERELRRSSAASSFAPPTQETQGGWSSRFVEPAIRAPVHEIHPATLRPVHSNSTGSTDSAGHDSQRPRHASNTDTRFPASNYIRPYIRETPSDTIRHTPSPTHVDLSWPLVEYDQRRSRGQPLITFDAGFNPRFEKYAVRALKAGDYASSPLSRQDCVMHISETAFVNWIFITCDKLPLWPIHLKLPTNLRVIDIFRAIYDTYSLPLTQEELIHFGKEIIGRCDAAFKQRCNDGPELACIAEKRGMLRIDMLRGRRIFKGLYPDRGRAGHYKLVFDDGPRRA